MPNSLLNTLFTQNVEISCKTICKTPCISAAKLCVYFATTATPRVKLCFSPLFHTTFTPSFAQHLTSSIQLTFPLFHRAYYYNY